MLVEPASFLARVKVDARVGIVVSPSVWRHRHDAAQRAEEAVRWTNSHARAALASGRAVSAFRLMREMLAAETILRSHYDVAIAMFTMVGRDGTGLFARDAIRFRVEELGSRLHNDTVSAAITALSDVGVIARETRRARPARRSVNPRPATLPPMGVRPCSSTRASQPPCA